MVTLRILPLSAGISLTGVWHFRGAVSFRASQMSDRDRLPIAPGVPRPSPPDALAILSRTSCDTRQRAA